MDTCVIIERENDATFKHGGGYEDWSFEIGDALEHCITDKQPWSGMRVKKDGEDTKIRIKAGRKGSKKVAEWFKSQSVVAYACDSFDNWPAKLNFAVKTTLCISVANWTATATIIIAQGHNARSRNNWWLGFCEVDKLDLQLDGAALNLKVHIETSGVKTFSIILKEE